MKIADIGRAEKSKKIVRATTGPRFDFRSFLTSMGAGRSTVKYRPKASVFRQGAAAVAVYFIKKGKIQLTVKSEHGKEAIIARLRAGQFFGEGCLAGQTLYMATAVASTESVVDRIEMATMTRVLREQPKLSEMFLSFLLSRSIQIQTDLVEQLFNSSERRLARLLMLLANFGKEGKMQTVIPKVSQKILAAKVGTTRAQIDFFMEKFRKLGFIEYDSGLPLKIGGLRVHTSLFSVIVQE